MKRASYREAIEWIAVNDDAGSDDGIVEISGYISTLLVSDVFRIDSILVARAVKAAREKYLSLAEE